MVFEAPKLTTPYVFLGWLNEINVQFFFLPYIETLEIIRTMHFPILNVTIPLRHLEKYRKNLFTNYIEFYIVPDTENNFPYSWKNIWSKFVKIIKFKLIFISIWKYYDANLISNWHYFIYIYIYIIIVKRQLRCFSFSISWIEHPKVDPKIYKRIVDRIIAIILVQFIFRR